MDTESASTPLLSRRGSKKNHWNKLTQRSMLTRALAVIGLLVVLIGGVWLLQLFFQNDAKDLNRMWNRDMKAIEQYSEACVDNISLIAPADFKQRQEALAATLEADDDAFAYVMEPSAAMLYFANLQWSRTERPFMVVFASDKNAAAGVSMTIVTPMFEETRAQEALARAALPKELDVRMVSWLEDASPYEKVVKVLGDVQNSKKTKVYVEATTRVFIAEALRAVGGDLTFEVASPAVQQLRMSKTRREIDLMKCANRVTHLAVQKVHQYIHPGMSESAVASKMEEALVHGGLRDTWVVALVDDNAAFPHGQPGKENTVRAGSLVLIDTGGDFYGYQSDMTRTFFIGGQEGDGVKVNQTRIDAWHTVQKAQKAVLANMKRGDSCAQVDLTARDVIDAAGLGSYFTHRLGHGIGLEMHEDPYMNRGNRNCHLQVGFTFSVEPGVYLPHEYGIRLEDIAYVTEDGSLEMMTELAQDPWHP
ncbi:peptidase M24, structural domain-containing protein [Gongronella butleri]|nr:peptidase M24, structural domain-containing protein [Gongronella butleri]